MQPGQTDPTTAPNHANATLSGPGSATSLQMRREDFSDAERYLRHEFDILGSGWRRVHYGMNALGFLGKNYSDVSMSWQRLLATMPPAVRENSERIMDLAKALVPGYEPIDWHIDIRSGYRSELQPGNKIAYGKVEGVDLKVTGDMSRCYALPQLAIAWRETNDNRFRDEAIAQMLDWLAANPTGVGPGWRANMNVAIRVVNWITALDLLFDGVAPADSRHRNALDLIEESLRAHLHSIAANLEFAEGQYHPNHYIANLIGLLSVSGRTRETEPSAPAWERLAWRELRVEIQRQVAEDGVDFEGSTAYHAFVLEMLTSGILLSARAAGKRTAAEQRAWLEKQLGSAGASALQKMFVVLQALTPPSGLLPLVGDNDSGRLVYLESPRAAPRDWRFLSCIGAALYEDPALLPASCGPEHWSAARRLTDGASPSQGTGPDRDAAFSTTGFYVMRGGGAYALVSAGPIGTAGLGGHAHNDRLAFTLEVDGREFLVDPGVFVYTASLRERNAGRSVLTHNTLTVDNQEQNRWLESSPWWGCHEDARCKCIAWNVTPDSTWFVGEHEGYLRLSPPVVHRRNLELKKNSRQLSIRDEIVTGTAATIPTLSWSFVLHPACDVELTGGTAQIQRSDRRIRFEAAQGEWNLEDTFFSSSYGVREDTKLLRLVHRPGVREQSFLISW